VINPSITQVQNELSVVNLKNEVIGIKPLN
jgi:hypothetical protein